MGKTKRFGVQGLAGTECETIVDKLLVFGERCAFQYLMPPILCIVEERMADVFEMRPDLMGTPGFQNTFHNVHIS